MKRSKIVTTLIVLFIVLSTMIVLNQLNIITEVSASTPGVDTWGNATTNLEYGVSYSSVYVNTTKWTGTGPFYLYYPTYRSGGTGGNANEFTWDGPYVVNGYYVRVTSIGVENEMVDAGGSSISFNRSGMWIFDSDTSHSGNTPSTYAGYLWVNTSIRYSIDSVPNFYYGSNESVTITVNTGNVTGCMIAIVNPANQTIYHKWRTTGVTEAIGKNNFTIIGTYTVKAYRDFDAVNSTYFYPDEYYAAGGVTENYSNKYGSDYTGNFPSHPANTPQYYSYANVGPWDPPEKNATEITFRVLTGAPPIANFTYTINKLSVTFNASTSNPNGNISDWLWNFGDDANGTGEITTHEYQSSGIYNVTLKVIDENGGSDSITKRISVMKYQRVFIFGKITNLSSQGDYITFQAVKTRVIIISPFSFITYIYGEKFTISKDYMGRIGVRRIFAMCEIVSII